MISVAVTLAIGGALAVMGQETSGRLLRGVLMPSSEGGDRFPDRSYPEGYEANLPKFASMLDVLLEWNPDVPIEPVGGSKFDTLERLDWQNERDRQRCFQLRDLEIPFKVYNIPNLNDVRDHWKSDKYILEGMNKRPLYAVSTAYNTHFMFYPSNFMDKELKTNLRPTGGYQSSSEGSNAYRPKGYTFDHPPPVPVSESFAQFWKESAELEAKNKQLSLKEESEAKHIYLTTGDSWTGTGETIIAKDIRLFVDAETKPFFVPDPSAVRGQHCRFGMRGVVAEQHWDGHRNSIYMIRGEKRYILNPPKDCKFMQAMHEGPSRRHSSIDFSSPEQLSDPRTAVELDQADTVETVLREGEVLYVPSYWLHYIVSLGRSIQCNTRSGISPLFAADAAGMAQCEAGIAPPPPSEEQVAKAMAKVKAKLASFRID